MEKIMQLPSIILWLTIIIFIIGAGYSVEALTCYVCSSDKLAKCATLQNQKEDLPFKLCPPNTDSCFSRIENGVTIRGCSPVQTVEPAEGDHYETCKTDKCNGDIFPEDRLFCLHCAGSNCVNQINAIDVRHPCVNYKDNDNCYSVFSSDGKVAYRGCSSESEISLGRVYCERHAQQCVQCSALDCNDKQLEWSTEKLSCIKCKSIDGKKCDEIDEDLAAEECAPVVEGYENKCYTYVDNGGIERGCLYEASVNVQKNCENKESCTLCTDSGCNHFRAENTVPLESDNESILHASVKQSNDIQPKICYAGELEPGKLFEEKKCKYPGDSCFTYIDGDKVIKGCKTEYLIEKNSDDKFFESLPKTMYDVCDSSLCNSQVIEQRECFVCVSKLGSDPKCVSSNDLKPKKCSLEMKPTNCYHYIDDVLGITKRGCMSDLQNDDLLNECKKNDEKCKQCGHDRCNMKPAFEKCLTCDADPTACYSAQCKDYDDQCYLHVDEFGVRRGCLSAAKDTAIKIVRDCENDDSICKLCSGEVNCNKNSVWEENCIVCDSKNQSQCIANPMRDFMRTKCAPTVKSLGCFTSLKDESRVVRGCMKSLSIEERKNYYGDSKTCKSCFGDSCNQHMYFFTCHACDSVKDPNCLMKPGDTYSTICEKSKKCYTTIVNGGIKRGCVGDIIVPQAEKCTGPLCDTCDDKMNCNSKPVHAEKCIECNSERDAECHSDSIDFTSKSKECELELTKKGCYHYIDEEARMKRGCVNKLVPGSVEHMECGLNPEGKSTSKICHDSDNCNAKKTFPKCLSCKYPEDPHCASNPSNFQTCKSYQGQCFTLIENRNVIRGCLGESEHQKNCFDGNKMCKVCDPSKEANCNKETFELEQCIECDSKYDGADCRSNPKKFKGQICNGPDHSKPEGCFVSIIGDHYKRGCISKISQDEKQKFLDQSSTCKSFSGSDSNHVISFQECYKCNSRDNPSCSSKSTLYTATEICESAYATCTTGVDDNGITHRRCSKDQSVEEKDFKHHEICEGAKCNGEIFPKNRLQCYRCYGDSDCEHPEEMNRKEKMVCNVYSEHDQCYTYMDKNAGMHRGCVSEPTITRMLCDMAPSKCIKCKESGCNNLPKLKKPSFSCIHCDGDKDCAYKQDKTKSKACTEMVPFNVNEACYARTIPNKKRFERGCTTDLAKQIPDIHYPESIMFGTMCFKSDCNTQNIIAEQCQKCSSALGEDCSSLKGKSFSVNCNDEPYPYDKRGCFTLVKDNQVERGCVKDLKNRHDECLKDPNACVICETDNCNSDDRNRVEHSFGHQMTSTILMNVFAVILLFLYY